MLARGEDDDAAVVDGSPAVDLPSAELLVASKEEVEEEAAEDDDEEEEIEALSLPAESPSEEPEPEPEW